MLVWGYFLDIISYRYIYCGGFWEHNLFLKVEYNQFRWSYDLAASLSNSLVAEQVLEDIISGLREREKKRTSLIQ